MLLISRWVLSTPADDVFSVAVHPEVVTLAGTAVDEDRERRGAWRDCFTGASHGSRQQRRVFDAPNPTAGLGHELADQNIT